MADTKFICPYCKHTSLIKTFEYGMLFSPTISASKLKVSVSQMYSNEFTINA